MQWIETRIRSPDRTFTFKGKLTPFETVARTISSKNVTLDFAYEQAVPFLSGHRKAKTSWNRSFSSLLLVCAVTRKRRRLLVVNSIQRLRFYPERSRRISFEIFRRRRQSADELFRMLRFEGNIFHHRSTRLSPPRPFLRF